MKKIRCCFQEKDYLLIGIDEHCEKGEVSIEIKEYNKKASVLYLNRESLKKIIEECSKLMEVM